MASSGSGFASAKVRHAAAGPYRYFNCRVLRVKCFRAGTTYLDHAMQATCFQLLAHGRRRPLCASLAVRPGGPVTLRRWSVKASAPGEGA